MYFNYWTERASEVIENEVILVKSSPTTKQWFDLMPNKLSVIKPTVEQLITPQDFSPKIGVAHHLRLTKHGIEGVLQAPRSAHRLAFYVLYDKIRQPVEPFWVIVRNCE